MRCEACHGIGYARAQRGAVLIDKQGRVVSRLRDTASLRSCVAMMVPCPECAGSGLAHCCEGERPNNNQVTPQHSLLNSAVKTHGKQNST